MAWSGTAESRGYDWAWKKSRRRILERDQYLCQPCKRIGRVTPATEVDHVIARAKGGNEDHANLQSICVDCHKAKTAAENGKVERVTFSKDGMPVW